MYDHQDFFNLDQNDSSNSWLSGGQHHHSSPSSKPPPTTPPSSNTAGFDRVLYKDLVEIVPLVESLMGRRANTAFTRRASLVYTKPNSTKGSELKGRKTAQSIPAKKRGDLSNNGSTSTKLSTKDYSILRARTSEKDKEPLLMLQEQVENLQKELLEKDELLRSRENSLSQMTPLQVKLDELRCEAADKDSLIKSVDLQLSDAKIKLADKQAALEKLQWEVSTSNRKIEKFREDLESKEEEMSRFMSFVEELTTSDCTASSVDYDTIPYGLDKISIDDVTKMEMQQMDEARQTYIAALAAAKESEDEELLEIAREARLRLQQFLPKPKDESLI